MAKHTLKNFKVCLAIFQHYEESVNFKYPTLASIKNVFEAISNKLQQLKLCN